MLFRRAMVDLYHSVFHCHCWVERMDLERPRLGAILGDEEEKSSSKVPSWLRF